MFLTPTSAATNTLSRRRMGVGWAALFGVFQCLSFLPVHDALALWPISEESIQAAGDEQNTYSLEQEEPEWPVPSSCLSLNHV